MAARTGKTRCITCDQEKTAVTCEGCLQLFCYDHLTEHRQELNKQLHHIAQNCDHFRQILNDQTTNSQKDSFIKQIDQWEKESIRYIHQTANECRQTLIQHTIKNIHQIEINLAKLTDEIREIRQEDDFNEINLNQFNEKLHQLQEQLEQPTDISIQQEETSFIDRIRVLVSSGKFTSAKHIHSNSKWQQDGLTLAGGNGEGNQLNQLYYPDGICVDDEERRIFVADSSNHRIVEWKFGASNGKVVAGGNGWGNGLDQLNCPTDVILDKNNDSLIICDYGNRRVIRWSCLNWRNQQTIISDIDCSQLTIDNNGDLYVSDYEKHEVRRWKQGDKNGTIVAGGNGKGDYLNQLNYPTFIFIDQEYSVYVSDSGNDRVMKWEKDAKEGIIVAGGQGQGNTLTRLSNPQGVSVDLMGNVYVADSWNHRIMRWQKGCREGSIIVGGNGYGQQLNQFAYPHGLTFDQQGNLYVIDCDNHRLQKFDVNI
ncbi:unnamed protein product [Adineta steineri]|uniref:Uncharacterized protein n=1 Tax=Adineta steineri TaxID=433720 RepID=A0A813X298_9BILA|nr:unnamed protein product [Adineta steineri]CAF1009197.1 unnamed protein product [Adineta steineri]CAF1411523.1 unnamed protein product [Adineta steineri]CAF1436955.1 unnamed protein product [Adineta steineri]CAF1626263.1 unnamed protein product [Adineta steineri]